MLWARLAVSMQQPVSGWQSSSWLRGSGGQMEAPHGSHALKIRAEGGEEGATNSPQMEGWGACRKEGAGRVGRAINVLKSCTVLPNTKQLITAQKNWNKNRWSVHMWKREKRSKLQIGLWSASRAKCGGNLDFSANKPPNQSGALNIAELESVWILQPSVLNRRWCRLAPALRSYTVA